MQQTATTLRRQIEQQYPGLPFHESVATFILGQWPRLNLHDPATYIKSMARVLAQFSDDAVIACADPATGVSKEYERVPSMKQLHDYLGKQAASIETVERYKAMPKIAAGQRVIAPPPSIGPNLFVPEDHQAYPAIIEMAKHPTAICKEMTKPGKHKCSDGKTRAGIWIPHSWWDYHYGNTKQASEEFAA